MGSRNNGKKHVASGVVLRARPAPPRRSWPHLLALAGFFVVLLAVLAWIGRHPRGALAPAE